MERVPVLRIGDALLVSVQGDLPDEVATRLRDDLADEIVKVGSRGVVIDISGLEIVDSFIGRMLSSIAANAKLLDAQTIVVGMRPAVAITLVELGLYLDGVRTALTVERAFELIATRSAAAALVADRVLATTQDTETRP